MARPRGLGQPGRERASRQIAEAQAEEQRIREARQAKGEEGDVLSAETAATSSALTTADVEDPSADYQIPPSTDVNPVQSEQETLPDYFVETPQSTRVVRMAYDRDSRRLYVRFVKPTKSGGTPWTYNDVPPQIWRNFQRAKSKGKYVNRVLTPRGNYNHGTWDEGY